MSTTDSETFSLLSKRNVNVYIEHLWLHMCKTFAYCFNNKRINKNRLQVTIVQKLDWFSFRSKSNEAKWYIKKMSSIILCSDSIKFKPNTEKPITKKLENARG